MKRLSRSTLLCSLLLCLAIMARGQTSIFVSGPTDVCSGSSYGYTVGFFGNTPEYFSWHYVNGTEALTVSPYSKVVLWGAPGTGQVIVTAFDIDTIGNGTVIDTLDQDTFLVTIHPLPAPGIVTDTRLACIPLDDRPDDMPIGQFLDTPCQKVCAYSTVTYTAVGDPTSTFTWSALGGNIIGTSTGPTCTVQWQEAGPGKITVNETTVNGCVGSLGICIDIVESPIANITSLPDTSLNHIFVCKGTEVVFIDHSFYSPASPIVSWRWDFGDGNFSNEKGGPWAPITHTYNTAGTYKVRLTVTNQCGCSTTDSILVEVSPDPGVEIICPGVVCEYTNFKYKVSSTCTGGTWSAIGGTINSQNSYQVDVTWDNVDALSGFGYLVYDPAGGCPGLCPHPVAKKIPVVKTTADIQGPDFLCIDKQYLYSLPQWPTTQYTWSSSNPNVTLLPTDQPNEIVLVPGTLSVGGSVTLTCNYTNTLLGCSGTATKVITIPDQVYYVDTVWEYCHGFEKVFYLGGPISATATGMWTLVKPDNSVLKGGPTSGFAVSLDQIGTYLLSVQGDFCPPETKEIRVLGIPATPEFIVGPNRICRGIPTEYLGGVIDQNHVFVWSLTNGSLNIPVGDVTEVVLDPAASYPFTLSVIRETKDKPHCRSEAFTKQIEAPIVVFFVNGEDTVCPSQYYNYFTGYEDSEEIVWSIFPHTMGSVDDGQGTTNVKVLWNKQPGVANLICRVTKCGVYSYDTLPVYIRPLVLDLTLSSDTVCMYEWLDAEVNVSTISGVRWHNGVEPFKSPSGVDFRSFVYHYPIKNITTYTITATVDTPWGCPSPISAQKQVVVVPAPRINVTPPIVWQKYNCLPIDTTFVATYDTAGVTPTGYQWWKNGIALTTDTFLNVTDTGLYKLVVTGPYPGCNAYPQVKVIPNCWDGGYSCDTCEPGPPPPYCTGYATVHVTSFDRCTGEVTLKRTLNNIAYYTGFNWRSSDDSAQLVTFTDSTAKYKILKAGVHRLYYNAHFNNSQGGGFCFSQADTHLVVTTVLDLMVEPMCYQSNGMRDVRLIDNSTSLIPITYHAFQVGGNYGIVYDGPSKSYVTSVPAGIGVDSFRLIVFTAEDSCSDDVFLNVPTLPIADFEFQRQVTCEKDAPVYFNNISLPSSSMFTHLWRFGDTAENTQLTPYRVYNDPGIYDVWLIETDQWGCKDSITKRVQIKDRDLRGFVSVNPDFPCEFTSATALFNNQGSHTPSAYYWYNMNGEIGQTFLPTDNWTVYKSGLYYAKVKDQYGCKHTSQADTVLFVKTAKTLITGGQDQCENVSFTLSGYAGQIPGLTYTWERDGGTISGATGADITEQLPAGTYIYNVTTRVTKPNGGFCDHRSDDFKVTVHPTPAAPLATASVDDCNDYTLKLDVSPTFAGTYNWSNGMQAVPIYVNHGGPYQVTYTDPNGCISKTKIETPKDLRVYLWIFPTGCYSICPNDPNIITGPIIKFRRWSYLHNGGSFAGGSGYFYDVSLNGTGPGVYNMYLENAYCNVTSGNMDVDTNCITSGPGSVEKFGSNTDNPQFSDPLMILFNEPRLLLAPNPATNSTHITYSYSGNNTATYVEVYDVLGRVMYGRQVQDNSGGFDMSLEHLAPGTYNVILRRGNEMLLHKNLSVTR